MKLISARYVQKNDDSSFFIPCVECGANGSPGVHIRMNTKNGQPGLGGVYCAKCAHDFHRELSEAVALAAEAAL